MTAGNGALPEFVLRGEFEDLEDRVDTTMLDVRVANSGIQRLEKVMGDHSDALAEIGQALVRIETRLSGAEQKAERASGTNEAFAQLALERDRVELERERKADDDKLAARKERRAAFLAGAGKAAAWLTTGGGIALLLSAVLDSCR